MWSCPRCWADVDDIDIDNNECWDCGSYIDICECGEVFCNDDIGQGHCEHCGAVIEDVGF